MGRLDDPGFGGEVLLLAGDLATVLLLTAGAAMAVLFGYRLDVDPGGVLAFCVLASVISTALHRTSRPWWRLGTAAAIALLFWITWEETGPALEWIAAKMGLLPGVYVVWTGRMEERLLPAFLLLCAAMAWLTGWAAVRLRAWYLAALLVTAPLLPAIQGGTLPAWGAMLAAFMGWGSMLLVSLFRREDPAGLGRAKLLSLAGMGVLILGLVAALPMEGYVRPQWATDARTNLILGVRRQLERHVNLEAMGEGILADLGLDLSLPGQELDPVGTGTASGGSAAVNGLGRRENLLAAGPRRYSGRQVLSVRTDQPDSEGRIYLRGGALGTYTGESWEMLADLPEEGFQPALYPALTAADGREYTMFIRPLGASGSTGLYPYRLLSGGWTDEAGLLTLPVEDGGLMGGLLSGGGAGYQIRYIPGGPQDGFTPLSGQWAEEEARYREEVIPGYLAVPDAARNALGAYLSSGERWQMVIDSMTETLANAGEEERAELEAQLERLEQMRQAAYVGLAPVDLAGAMSVEERLRAGLDAAARTAAVLGMLAVYDPNTPAMEPGEDFVTHFLEEGRGYCVHFATAGALLLRMQGIPARYVSGYTVRLDAAGRGQAMDSDAHAWVEIYLDGYGWYPVEMTPGYTGGGTGAELADGAAPEDPEESEEPKPDEEPEEELPPEEMPEEEPGQTEDPGDELGQEGAPGEEEARGGGLWRALWRLLAGTGGAAGLLGALYALAAYLRRRERALADANRSVIRAYRRYERALDWGGAKDEKLEELGRKARFSQHILTEEERETAWKCLDAAVGELERQKKKGPGRLFTLLRPLL